MKILLTSLFTVTIAALASALPHARDISKAANDGGTTNGLQAKSANCSPSTAKLFLNFNDVNALIEVGGSMWQDRNAGASSYEVPAGGKNHVLFSGSIWMGGTDVNGQLKLAAVRFRTGGNDFWGGPLSQTVGSGNYDPSDVVGLDAIRDFGAATIDPDVCVEYDKFFTISKAEVIRWHLQYDCDQDPTCSDDFGVTAELTNRILNWPAHGDVSRGQDFYLAPFYDRNSNNLYEPEEGDSPWFDDILGRDDIICGSDRRISLFGDQSNWWVFNDKGNIHTESSGDPIGMEIRAQAFAFATNDEVNQMTFYNYEMINRGTQTLFDTYFSSYADSEIGLATDDYVGCDVSRGLAYGFNGDAFDEGQTGAPGYGENPPAFGIDFFEGPYQDADNKDNVGPRVEDVNGVPTFVTPSVNEALADDGIVYRGIGIGYSDGIVDNERYGMRSFMYYTNGAAVTQSDPSNAAEHYRYMQALWANGNELVYGGSGFAGSTGSTSIRSYYAFPDDSDPLNWGTEGVDPGFVWSEVSADGNNTANPAGDRRILESAGPFTLTPGAVNNLTIGVVYGRSYQGGLFASVEAVKIADTKAQALFDNCFRILDPPSAPVLEIQELENELVLFISNPFGNNVNEEYEEEDKINIVDPLSGAPYDKFYRFEGYQIFQMSDDEAGVSDLENVDKARLVAQCDLKNDVERLINFEFNEDLGFSTPVEKVNGANDGIRHSFSITEDQFAVGNRTLVNHKTYYYIAVAYAYNNYKDYDPTDADKLDGQKIPYISSRLAADGTAIKSSIGIPHDPRPEADGTYQNIGYGSTPKITRLDGTGNGFRVLDLDQASVNEIVASNSLATPTYDFGKGPINVKVVDPLNLADGYFNLRFVNYTDIDEAFWQIDRFDSKGGTLLESVTSERTIAIDNEQLIPEWGISVQIEQVEYYCANGANSCPTNGLFAEPLEATIEFADSSKRWLIGVPDTDGFFPTNWIRSGDYTPTADDITAWEATGQPDYTNPDCYDDAAGTDDSKLYAKLLNGTVTHSKFIRYECEYMPVGAPTGLNWNSLHATDAITIKANSVDIIVTSDKSKWTRCPVFELGRDNNLTVGGADDGELRASPSVNKEGNPDGTGNGMGWFPGYAIDIETGVRLNMGFGENSFLSLHNGSDMLWNPTSTFTNNVGEPILGGQHAVYVFREEPGSMPIYDEGAYIYNELSSNPTGTNLKNVYESIMWIMNPMTTPGQEVNGTDVKVRLRINKEYAEYTATGQNAGAPSYEWNMADIATTTASQDALTEVLDLINVVPNPYYAYSSYERDRLDSRIKITNLPERCDVKIYNVSGKLIRSFKKDDPMTSIDWDMKNGNGIPVSSGVYIIHVNVEGIGEAVVKWFGGVRQSDLQNL